MYWASSRTSHKKSNCVNETAAERLFASLESLKRWQSKLCTSLWTKLRICGSINDLGQKIATYVHLIRHYRERSSNAFDPDCHRSMFLHAWWCPEPQKCAKSILDCQISFESLLGRSRVFPRTELLQLGRLELFPGRDLPTLSLMREMIRVATAWWFFAHFSGPTNVQCGFELSTKVPSCRYEWTWMQLSISFH